MLTINIKHDNGNGLLTIGHKDGSVYRCSIAFLDAQGWETNKVAFDLTVSKDMLAKAAAYVESTLPNTPEGFIKWQVKSDSQTAWNRELLCQMDAAAIALSEGLLPDEVQDYLTEQSKKGFKLPADLVIKPC